MDAAPPSETLHQCRVAEMLSDATTWHRKKQNLRYISTPFARVPVRSGQTDDEAGAGFSDNFQIQESVNFEWLLQEHLRTLQTLQDPGEDPCSYSMPHWLETVCQSPRIREHKLSIEGEKTAVCCD